jgi:hypothetical protein
VRGFGWKLAKPMTPPLRAGDFQSRGYRWCFQFVTCGSKADPTAPSSAARLLSGQCHGFPHRHLQSFAQRGKICVARTNPAAFPIVDRHLRDTQPVRELGDREALFIPRLADLFT